MAGAGSYLFVPANRPERYAKALGSGADAVIVDLEDAVGPELKTQARDALHDWLQAQAVAPRNLWIRINAADTGWHADDLRCFADAPIGGIMLPKADAVEVIRDIAQAFTHGQRVLPLIESARGVARMRELAAAPGVARLAFGAIDLQVDLDMQCDAQESELLHFRLEMVLASRLAGIEPPVDGVTTAFDDPGLVEQAARRARRLGFGAKLCIHPRQVAAVNRAFLPSADELAWARAVMAAVEAGDGGAISLDGKMIDKPVILQAQRMLQQHAAHPADGRP
jgi:citrate lyase subunit beta/citryl-CoA lyase